MANNVTASGGSTIYIAGNGNVTTTGTVMSGNDGITIGGTGASTVTINHGSAVSAADEGIYDAGSATINVYGSLTTSAEQAIVVGNVATLNVSGTVTSDNSSAVYVANTSGGSSAVVTGIIRGLGADSEGLHFDTGSATVTVGSTGTITGTGNGLYIGGTATLVTNNGTISDTGTNVGDAGIHINGTALSNVVNTGTITGPGYGIYDGGALNLFNSGIIHGTGAAGVFTNNTGTSTFFNSSTGSITGSTFGIYSNTLLNLTNQGSIQGNTDSGVFLVTSGSTVNNSGLIYAELYGVYAESDANVTNDFGGAITGSTKDGIEIFGNGTVLNSGTVTGGVNGIDVVGTGNITLQGGAIMPGTGDAVLLSTGNDTVTINGRTNANGLIDGETGSNTIVFNIVGITPAEKASLDMMLATGMGNITIGGDNYHWQNFQTGIDHSISLELVVDPGLQPLAIKIDSLTTALPLAFDPYYIAALGNPEGATDMLAGREVTEAENNVAFNFTTQLQALITDRAANLATGVGGIDTTGLRFDDGTRLAMAGDLQNQLGALSLAGTEMRSDSKDMSKQMESTAAAAGPRWGAWVSGTAEFADEDSQGGLPGYHYIATSPSVGLDYRITPHFALGALFNYSDSGVDFADNGHLDADTELAGLYAVWAQDGWRVNALGGYGFNQYDSDRAAFGSIAHSSPDGDEITAGGTFAYDFKLGRNIVLSPEVGLDYTHLDVDSFSETGAGVFDLSVGDRQADSLRTHLGGRASATFACGPVTLTPQVNAAWYHEFLDNENGVTTSIGGAPAIGSFLVRTQPPERDFALVGAGIGIVPNCCDRVTIFFNYDAQVGQSDFMANTVDGGVRIGF